MATVTLDRIEELLGKSLSTTDRARAQLDIDAVYECLSGWMRRKLVETAIVDERHIGVAEFEELRFDWRPVKSVQGVRWSSVTSDLVTVYNDFWHELIVPRDAVYYISYTTKADDIAAYAATIERIVANAVIHPLLMADTVRYNVISSYTVEGLSISYNNQGQNTGQANSTDFGPIPGTDLTGLARLRSRVIA